MKSAKKVLSIIGNTILWLFVLFAVLVTVLVFSAQNNKDGLANIFGKSMVTILTDSMSPTFKAGDMIFDEVLTTEQKSNCEVDDIITFYSDLDGDGNDEINTHSIVAVRKEGGYTYYTTQGDNEETNKRVDDTEVIHTKVLGRYTGQKLSGAGRVIGFLQTSTGFLCVVVIPLVLFFLFELYNFITVVVKVKSKGKISAEDEEEIKRRAIEEYRRQMSESVSDGDSEKKE